MNAARFIVETIRLWGTDVAFGLPGVHALGLWKALEETGLRYVGLRHEHAAAHAADGYGRASGRPGVVFLSTGPGALNSLSALGEALVSSSPVLAIASGIPSKFSGRGKGYLHETNDLVPAYASVTRYSERVSSAQDLPKALDNALGEATAGRPGPALLEVCSDVFDLEVDAQPAAPSPRPHPPSSSDVQEAAGLLALAARPLIWAGGGVLRGRASWELLGLAEALQAPVITTFMGKGAIPENHPLSVGTMVRQPEAARLLAEADLLLSVGSRFSGMATGNWSLEIPSQHIQIDIDQEELGRNYPLRLGIRGHAKEALLAITAALESHAPPASRSAFVAAAADARRAALDRAAALDGTGFEFIQAIRAAVPQEVTTVHDMTVASYWAAPFLEVNVPNTFHYPYGFGSLGFSLPAAIGVAAARPGESVVSFSGDGGLQYHSRELATIAEHRLPVIALVFNDQSWGVLRSFSRARYDTEFGMDLPGPDFVALGAAYGIAAERADEPQRLHEVLSASVSRGEPRLIEVPGRWELPPPSEYYRR